MSREIRKIADKQRLLYGDIHFVLIKFEIEFKIKDNGLSLRLEAHSINNVAITFVIKDDELNIQLRSKIIVQ